MQTKEWQRVEELFHATLMLEAVDRAAYLARECSGNESLRHEVESLVASFESGHSFIEQPALSIGMRIISDDTGGSLVGCSIGHYKIVQLLGKGGMGEVYLAEDSMLERPVALKFIANNFVDDEWAREQLMNEARAVARLENSNICAVYGVEVVEGYNFIVMQYVEGETLASLLRQKPLDFERTLDIAEQIARALCAAHVRGIIHRDIKPQNIIVMADGQVKVLDFGLAKFVQQKQDAGSAGDKPDRLSQPGLVVGTVAYMSPEQTQGEDLDGRSDIFNFGIVLYEMLCGQNPFLRHTAEETIAAIKLDDMPLPPPSCTHHPRELLDGPSRIVRKCLEKEPARRYETADQLLLELRALRINRERPPATSERANAFWKRGRFGRYAAASLALLLLLIVSTGFVYQRLSTVHTLAVLPISNKSANPGLNYLSIGLTRNLYDKLSYLPRLRVKLPTGVASGAEEEFDPVRYGRALKVEAVVFGELVGQGDSLLLHVSVLNTADGSLNWEQTFNVGAGNLFELQDEVSRQVAAGFGLWLLGNEKKLLSKRQTDDEDALRLYMRGRDYWSIRDRDNIQMAIDCFEKAVRLDPAFAEAYAGLADSYMLLNLVSYGSMPTKEVMDKARFAVNRALYINDMLCDAHTSLATIKLRYDRDWYGAEREYKQAIALNPDYAPAHYGYSNFLAVMGRFNESVRESEAAKSLDPYSPLSEMNYGRTLYYARQFEQAAAQFHKMLEKNPDHSHALYMLGLVLLQKGQYQEALVPLEKLYAKDKLFAAAPLGYVYGKTGQHELARGVLQELEEISMRERKPVPSQESAIIHIGLGDRDKAFALLEEAYAEKFTSIIFLTAEPLFDDLRPDPRFANLAHRLKLTP